MVYVLILDDVVIQKQPNPQQGFIEAPDSVVCGQIANGDGTYSDPTAAPAIPAAPVPYLYAVGNLQVANQDISGIETSVNFSAAMWLDVGQYLLFFSESQANVQFMAKAYSGSCQALIVEKTEDYLSITAADSTGAFDPAEFSVEVIRISNNG